MFGDMTSAELTGFRHREAPGTTAFIMVRSDMRHTVSTNNNYLRTALLSIMDDRYFYNSFCFIDLDSFSSLSELLNIVAKCERDYLLIHLVGGVSMYSDLFYPFDLIGVNYSVDETTEFIETHRGISPTQLKKFIFSCKRLTQLTISQARVCSLAISMEIDSIGKHINRSEKSVYRHLREAAITMNFRSLLRFRYFLSKECLQIRYREFIPEKVCA